MQRQRLALDEHWQFLYDRNSQLSIDELQKQSDWRPVQVEMPWHAQFDDLRLSTGTGWYSLSFNLPENWQTQTVILHFGAVFYHAQVWLNGHYLGEDESGYLPFEFLIQDHLREVDKNELIVRATTPNTDIRRYPDYPFNEILHGKQSWYGHWGGIWQSVWVENRASCHIKNIQVFTDVDTNSVTCDIDLSENNSQVIKIELIAPNGSIAISQTHPVSDAHVSVKLFLAESPLLWSPDTPNLYTMVATLDNRDSVSRTCGFRTIETRDGQILLNGEPFYMRGALDQDYYPDTLSTPPSLDFLEDQLHKARAMGLNTIRYHIKIADPRYYEVADRIGMLLWVDLPTWSQLTERVKERVQETFMRMLQRDGHHPSIAIWTIVNEDWGTDLVNEAAHRQWLIDTFDWLKTQETTRLIVDNSACEPNFHLKSDIDDYHFYRAFPERMREWDDVVKRFAERDGFSYSPNGDAQRSYQEPLILSEFGNWGLPFPEQLHDEHDKEPWWFETGHDWAEGIVYPHGMKHRFYQWSFDRVFGTYENLINSTQWQQYNGLKYEIESMRLHPAIQGYIITELTDLHWECNGLLDMRRNPRVFHEQLTELNADILIIPRVEKYAYESDELITITLSLSAINPANVASVQWQMDNQQGSESIEYKGQSLVDLETVSFTAPQVTEPEQVTLEFKVLDSNKQILNRNHIELVIVPQQTNRPSIYSPDVKLAEQLSSLGFTITATANLWIATHLDDTFKQHLLAGGKGLLLSDLDSDLPLYESGVVIQQAFPYLSISARQNTVWQGDWVSTFSWIAPELFTIDALHSPLMGLPFAEIMSNHVFTGIGIDDFQHAVLSGLFTGWLHRPVATTIKRNHGKGQLILTTLNLLEPAVAGHPLARYILHQLSKM